MDLVAALHDFMNYLQRQDLSLEEELIRLESMHRLLAVMPELGPLLSSKSLPRSNPNLIIEQD